MDSQVQSENSSVENTLQSKIFGVNPTQYYRPEPRLGFTPYAELWNGRLAMVGVIVALAFELLSKYAF
ncbi:MAG: high light inducible protein [Phormidesmis priestleyi]|uniref:High light inducible protein n=1 Tax=Phormidesmis priestleyi TaxID=268141 RepID=A0A2W4X9G2_9CYAN|nr:MAG: high light inducible protein [Phormidesmis priestleyi]